MLSFLTVNSTSGFLLTDFPKLEWAHHWISIPVFSVYLTAILGNATILHIVHTDLSLQQPIYYFLAMLASTDLGLHVSTTPTVLGFYGLTSVTSTSMPVSWLHYCYDKILSHSYCLHQDMIHLSCSNTRFNSLYALIVILLSRESHFLFILLSYVMIFHSVLVIASHKEQLKILNTCVSHILAILCFYVPVLGLWIVHQFARHSSPIIHIVMGNVYIFFPPLMNPIIYSIKTQQILRAFIRVISLGGFR